MFVLLRPQQDFETALTLMEVGRGDSEIARLTGIPRPTISGWRHGRGSTYHRRLHVATPGWRPTKRPAYAYLLGIYLGDGCIVVNETGSAWIAVSLDARYPGIVAEAADSMDEIFSGSPVRLASAPGATLVRVHHPALPFAFPQCGPGPKHLREIVLADWQARITREQPRAFLRGLIHSDGCRCINRFETQLPSGRLARYEYPRYFFSNLSEDIRRLFCEHCDLLEIRWTRSNARNISISHRHSVALLDEFVGPKA
jgi:hypothetical protein